MAEKEKPQAKIEIKLGNLKFSGEGDQEWLSKQLEKVIESADALAKVAPEASGATQTSGQAGGQESGNIGSLASYLKAKNAEKSQTRRFLATADWVRQRGGEEPLTTGAIAKALTENHQSRLGNPSDCLNKNVAQGYCEKLRDGGFFITQEGHAALGSS